MDSDVADMKVMMVTMTEGVTIKFVAERKQNRTGDIRSVRMDWPVSYSMLNCVAERLFGVSSVKFRYIDDEGDRILITSQFELDCAYITKKAGICRLTLLTELPLNKKHRSNQKPRIQRCCSFNESPNSDHPGTFDIPYYLQVTDMEQHLLKELYDIGFDNIEYNLRLLRKNSNDMDSTIKHLLSRCH